VIVLTAACWDQDLVVNVDCNFVIILKLGGSWHFSTQLCQSQAEKASVGKTKACPDVLHEGVPSYVIVTIQVHDLELLRSSPGNENPSAHLLRLGWWRLVDNHVLLLPLRRAFQLSHLEIRSGKVNRPRCKIFNDNLLVQFLRGTQLRGRPGLGLRTSFIQSMICDEK